MSQFSSAPSTSAGLRPHRGGTVLALGILSLTTAGACGIGLILSIIGLVMGNGELKGMNSGQVDPAGRNFAVTGRNCSIIGLVIGLLMLLLGVLYAGVVAAIIAGAASQAARGGAPAPAGPANGGVQSR